MDRKNENIILIIIFLVSFALLFYGQRHIGYMGLGLEIIGLIGLIIILYVYNKRYK